MLPDGPAPKGTVLHYYQFNIGDYASHTRHLSLLEDLAFRRLLDAYYLHERPLNACSTSVARQIGMRDNKDEVESVLSEFFTLTDEGWVNKRADDEIATYHGKREQASKAGKASAEKRWLHTRLSDEPVISHGRSTDVQRTLHDRSTDVQPNINHKPITNNQETTKNKNIHSRFDAHLFLSEQGVEENLIADWMTLRRAKKLPLTETAINGVKREATKAGLLLADAITICCERGWGGFKAEWLDELKLKENRNGKYADFVAELTGSNRKDRAENVIDGNAERLD